MRLLWVTQQSLTWAAPHLASLSAVYIPGIKSLAADFLSHQRPLLGEWRPYQVVVQCIWDHFRRVKVDLFTSRESAHCPWWLALADDSSSLDQDALAHDWPNILLLLYAYWTMFLSSTCCTFLKHMT